MCCIIMNRGMMRWMVTGGIIIALLLIVWVWISLVNLMGVINGGDIIVT